MTSEMRESMREAIRMLVYQAEEHIDDSKDFPSAIILCVVRTPLKGGTSSTMVSAAVHPGVRMTASDAFMEAKNAIDSRMAKR